MDSQSSAMCKVILHDNDPQHLTRIRQFCGDNNLVAVKSHTSSIMDILVSNVDLGAVFLSESSEDDGLKGLALCAKVHSVRPELPIIFRRNQSADLECEQARRVVCKSYTIETINEVRSTIDEHIFNKHYPNELIRGIEEITSGSLRHLFSEVDLETSFPYLIKDRIIYGELFSLIPLESSWCRGYMMLQTEQKHIIDLIKPGLVSGEYEDDFRAINDVLSEVTNMIWGGIKNRYITDQDQKQQFATQVPIIVNHQNKYITFGTATPQLCFKYILRNRDDPSMDVTLLQKFVFSLNWSPEKFCENQPTVDDFLDSGELEFF